MSRRPILWTVAIAVTLLGFVAGLRVARVRRGAATIPVYDGARESGGRTRYFPRLLSWDDRSSARVDRIFALPDSTGLGAIAIAANAALLADGWYLVTPDDLRSSMNPQVVVWQRDPDERLDLSQLWPVPGVSRTERLYGGVFPPEFLDSRMVIGWTWALDGPRSARPEPPLVPLVRFPERPVPPAPPPSSLPSTQARTQPLQPRPARRP